MSPKLRKYLPAWVPWCVSLFTVPAWVWLSYAVLCTDRGRDTCGVGDWVLSSLIVAGTTFVLFLMGYRKLTIHYSQEPDLNALLSERYRPGTRRGRTH